MSTLTVGTAVGVPDARVRGYAYSVSWRVLAATLIVVSGAGAVVLFGLLLWATDPPLTPGPLFVLFGVFVALPGLLLLAIRRRSAASLEVDHLTMAITRRGLRLEIPSAAIKEVLPWIVPLPSPGFSLRMGSGRKLRYGIETSELATLLRALAETAEVSVAIAAAGHPSVVYATARSASCPRGWRHAVFKFVLFSLFPAGVLFNAHQHIAYGGPLGEYYMLGPRAYARTFLVYWGTTMIYLVLYAGVWRVAVEVVSLAVAWSARAYAATVRRLAENVFRVAYYGGVPLMLLLRFLP